MRGVVVLCLLVTGCDLVFGPAPGVPAGDAAADHDAGPDADLRPDAMLGGFSPPVKITIAGVIPVDSFFTDPSLTGDEQRISFVHASNVADSADIVIAQAVSFDGLEWGIPSMIPPSMRGRDDTNPKFAEDATLLYAAISTGGTPAVVQVWNPDTWEDVTAIEANGLETPDDERPGTPTSDLRHMVIQRKIGNNPTQLVEYKRDGSNPWVEVAGSLALVNAIGSATNPQLIANGRVLVFAGRAGTATIDLYVATRDSVELVFSAPVKLPGVSTEQADEADPWLSGDGRRLWFSRAGGSLPAADWGIYFTSRP